MFIEFSDLKKLSTQDEDELGKSNQKNISTPRNNYYRKLVANVAEKLELDINNIESETKQLIAKEVKQIKKDQKESFKEYANELTKASKSSRKAWQQFAQETDEVLRVSSGNPHIWITSDTATVRQLEPEIDLSPPLVILECITSLQMSQIFMPQS